MMLHFRARRLLICFNIFIFFARGSGFRVSKWVDTTRTQSTIGAVECLPS